MRPAEKHGDDGFTLIELVITVIILTVVLGALAMGIVTLLRTNGVTTDRLIASHDADLLASWVTTDVQSSAGPPDLQTTTKPGCGDDGALPAGGVNVARMTWTDRSTGTVYHAAYRVEQVRLGPPPAWQLVRYFCPEGQLSTHFPVVRALRDGSVCTGGLPATAATCVVPQPWPRFDLHITSVSGNETYPFTATATARAATSGIDATAPVVQTAVAYNTDAYGYPGPINRVVLTFNEALDPDYAAPLSRWTLHNAPDNAAVTAVAVANHSVTLTLSASGSPIVTNTAGFTIDLQPDPHGVRDGAGNASGFSGQPVLDGMAPVILSAVTGDGNRDGKIDQIKLTLSEAMTTTQPSTTPFTITVPTSPGWSGVNLSVASATWVNGTTVLLNLSNAGPTPVPFDTAATGLTLAMAADPNALRDTFGNFGAWAAVVVGDGVAPALLDITSNDVDHDGLLDHLVANFSEPLAPSTLTSQWSLSRPGSWPSAPTVTGVSVAGPQVTLAIGNVPFVDTAATGLQATLTASGSGIQDAAGNQSAFNARSVADGMAPVLPTLTFNRGGLAGSFEPNDSLTATFSEPLTPLATTSVSVVLARPTGKPMASISIPDFTNGAVDVGTGSYFNGDGHAASWPATVTVSGPTVNVTLTGGCAPSSECLFVVPGTTATMTLSLAPNLVDPAGNAAVSPTLSVLWF